MSNKPRRANRKQRREEARRQAAASSPQISYWMVAFLDLLGYRQVLEALDADPPLPQDAAGVARLTAALARAMRLRCRLHASFEQFMVGHRRTEAVDLEGVPPHLQQVGRQLRAVRVEKAPGPDHYILAASLAPAEGNFPMRSVYSVVAATAGGMLTHLAIGSDDPSDTLPLRGGIDIAPGAVVAPENFLYSPALSRAYRLESEKAVYPRTLIGERVEDLLRSVVERPGDDIFTTHAREVAVQVQRMFFVDSDRLVALDFYGPAFREILEGGLARDLGQKAWTYATATERLARERGDDYVTRKYELLVAYMGPRRHLWT